MHTDEARTIEPFITAYGEHPVVVMTEIASTDGQVHASVVRPQCLRSLASGVTWHEAHWQLFNGLLTEYMNLDRNRSQLGPDSMLRLAQFDELKHDGTLKLLAAIARGGFPPGLATAEQSAPSRVEAGGQVR